MSLTDKRISTEQFINRCKKGKSELPPMCIEPDPDDCYDRYLITIYGRKSRGIKRASVIQHLLSLTFVDYWCITEDYRSGFHLTRVFIHCKKPVTLGYAMSYFPEYSVEPRFGFIDENIHYMQK